ncbi:MAG: hypothetical protein K6T90_08895 [Leptolyngbyaceae cyanobacterium HOT.MB2.61]|nr:hypothetical protein [Leptolyngbyaceae cyanobacterium HOT.MB2.61]
MRVLPVFYVHLPTPLLALLNPGMKWMLDARNFVSIHPAFQQHPVTPSLTTPSFLHVFPFQFLTSAFYFPARRYNGSNQTFVH